MAGKQAIRVRKSLERGYANHGWLSTYHTFSFANYHEPKFSGFRSLRVLNEDRVKGGKGFGSHPHQNYEIFSYVVSGALEHRDSLGNVEALPRGSVQFTSTGKGIWHSEYNHSKTKPVHFLQMWVRPNQLDLEPDYQTQTFDDEQKRGRLCRIVSATNSGGGNSSSTSEEGNSDPTIIRINQDVEVFACLLPKNEQVSYSLPQGRYAYVHLVDREGAALSLNGIELQAGDGAFVDKATELEFVGLGDVEAEFLLFDLA
ncbi:Quercetin 2,3-dioxygenase [Balamuthia mandrillaris]